MGGQCSLISDDNGSGGNGGLSDSDRFFGVNDDAGNDSSCEQLTGEAYEECEAFAEEERALQR